MPPLLFRPSGRRVPRHEETPATRRLGIVGRGASRGLLSTTREGVERLLLTAYFGFRLLSALVAVVSIPLVTPRGLRRFDLAAVAVLLVEIGVLALLAVRRDRYDDPRLGTVDIAVNIALFAVAVMPRVADPFDSWADWGFPLTIAATVGAGVAFPRLWQSLAGGAALGATYLGSEMIGQHPLADPVTVVDNTTIYVVFAGLAWFLSTYLRRLATDADLARAETARTATRLERAEQRNLLHDQASVLALLAQDDLDDQLMQAARAQAAAGSAQIRAFLAGRPPHSGTLGTALAGVAGEFTDLPLSVNIALASADLPAADCSAVAGAVRTLLHNVRRHARASAAVLHAVTTATDWDVTVTDDGVGFDPAKTGEGYGLSQQVRGSLGAIDGGTVVESAPGAGTTVRLHGPIRARRG